MGDAVMTFGDLSNMDMTMRKSIVENFLEENVAARLNEIAAIEEAKRNERRAYDTETDEVLNVLKRARLNAEIKSRTPITTISFYAPVERKEVNFTHNPNAANIDPEKKSAERKRFERKRTLFGFLTMMLALALVAVNILWP